MRRTVTIEIDSDRFSKAFRTMTGDQAREMLVMLACGGHAVSSHSACLSEIGVTAVRQSDPCAEQACVDAKVARAAKDFLAAVGPVMPSVLFNGLADRPKPGSKQKARETFRSLLGAIYELRKGIEFAQPLRLVPSSAPGGQDEGMKLHG